MRREMWIPGVAALLAAVVVVGAVYLGAPGEDPVQGMTDGGEEARTIQDHEARMAELAAAGVDTLTDTDGDGLPDAIENFIYGSDPQAFSTTGNGIPDGWFARYGYDPTLPGVERLPAAIPPGDALPDVYEGEWPDRYRWTLADVYFYGMPANWTEDTYFDNGIDPNQWRATPDGLPTSWLVHHFADQKINETGELKILEPGLPGRSLTGDGFTVRDNFEHDTDPTRADTAGNALSDADEVNVYGTDPRKYSTSGTGIADGWLVLHQLDPVDPTVGSLDPAGKGMSVQKVWEYNLERYGEPAALRGQGLDPGVMSERGDSVPDGWLIDHGLDPLDEDLFEEPLQCASHYEHVRHLEGQDDIPEGMPAIPDLCLRLEDIYEYGRPSDWDEREHGVWEGGLDPANGDQDDDGLPDAVEIRGWYIERTVDVGPGARTEWIHVTSDPRQADTDGDGLTDHEEYHGRAERNGEVYVFSPTDPSNPDTAFSGMTDAEKVFATYGGEDWDLHERDDDGNLRSLLDPTKRDSAADYLADGEAMDFWIQARDNVLNNVPYGGEGGVYPDSFHRQYLDWINNLGWLESEFGGNELEEAAALLAPDGDVDNDGVANVVDPSASGDGLLNGWQVNPSTLRFSDFPPATDSRPRAPTDPANPDTSGDRLMDAWKLRYGQWDDKIGGWDLDPAKWDSNGDGESDARGNLNDDVVVWHSYSGTSVTPHEWPYMNILEQQFDTNPRVRDETGNGVTEGWVIFWSFGFYDEWVLDVHTPGREPAQDPGDRIPSENQILDMRHQIAALRDPNAMMPVKDEVEYLRWVEGESQEDALAEPLDPDFDEAWVSEPKQVDVLRGDELESRWIGFVSGLYEHSFVHDQQWGLNPYLTDTVMDGIRDAWGAFYGRQCSIDPASPEMARQDPDRDGLTNLQEYSLSQGSQPGDWSTNPCLSDTDLDGLSDGEEVELGLNPLNAEDAAQSAAGEGVDTSGDGVPDFEKIQRGLDPLGVDTDRDGLLDGRNLPARGQEIGTGPGQLHPEDIEKFKALGIAHREFVCPVNHPDDPGICFYGEDSNNGDPLNPESLIRGIPDGWVVYYGETDPDDPGQLRTRYACSMPEWWESSRLGVWWWGLGPGEDLVDGQCPRDRDRDGLDDYNGEDPVAGASQSNRAVVANGSSLAPHVADLLEDDSIHRFDLVKAAQGWGECAGNPGACFAQWEAAREGLEERQGPVRLEVTSVSGVDGSSLYKEEPFMVTGRLVTDCPGCPEEGVPHRTVVVRLADAVADAHPDDGAMLSGYRHFDGRVLGLGFTDPDGGFEIEGCLCAGGGVETIPAEGIVALSRSHGEVRWDTKAAEIPVGSTWRLGLHAYASTPTFWGGERDDESHPQYLEIDGFGYNATRSAWEDLFDGDELGIKSGTRVTIDAPGRIEWDEQGRSLRGSVTLLDDSGGPVPFQKVFLTGIESRTLETDVRGDASFTLNLDPAMVGDRVLQVGYTGDNEVGWEGSVGTSDVVLQAPVEVHVEAGSESQRLGEAFTLDVRVTSMGEGVGGVALQAVLGQSSQRAHTTSDGHAEVTLVPRALEPGPAEVRVTTNATDHFASASLHHGVRLVSGSSLSLQAPQESRLAQALPVEGRLTLTDGSPIAGGIVELDLAGHGLGQLVTDGDGRFKGAPFSPIEAGVGTHTLTVWYSGDEVIDEAVAAREVRFSVGTRVAVEDVHVGRGQDAVLEGRLTTVSGDPLVGEFLSVQLPWNETLEQRVTGGGFFTHVVSVPGDHPLGVFEVIVQYDGSVNGTYGASIDRAELWVGAPAHWEVDPLGSLHRGNNTVTARLLDSETNEPIAGVDASIVPSFGGDDGGIVARTDGDGRVRLALPVGRDVEPGHVYVSFQFEGDERYAPTVAEAEGVLRVPARLVVSVPSEFGRGTDHRFEARLMDDRGVPLPGRLVDFGVLGSQWNITTDDDGSLVTSHEVPLDAPLGESLIRVSWAGDEAHEAVRVDRTVVVKDGVHVRVEGVPDEVRPGDRVSLQIHVEDMAGNPVQTTLVVRVDRVPGSMLVETDPDGFAEVSFVVPDGVGGMEHLRLTVRFPGTDELAARTEVFEPTFMPASTGEPEEGSLRLWLALTAGLSAAGVAGAAAFLVVRYKRANRVVDILEGSRKSIEAGDPWTGAVLLAYQQLVEHLGDHGVEDPDTGTPRTFAQHLVDIGFMEGEAAAALVSLFERARYAGDGELSKEDALRAREILGETIRSAQRSEATREALAGS